MSTTKVVGEVLVNHCQDQNSHQLNSIYSHLNFITAYSLLISALLILKDRHRTRGSYAITAFVFCVFLYLVIDEVKNDSWLHYLMIAGPSLLPFTFWLMARSMFRDRPLSTERLSSYTIGTLFVYYSLYFLRNWVGWLDFGAIAGRVVSIFFVIMALIEAQTGRESDLDENRIRLRKYFTYIIGITVLITILAELGLDSNEQQFPRIVQRASILVINTIFIVSNFSIKSSLFDIRKKNPTTEHPDIVEKIQSKMVEEGFYRKEKLTIGQLAEAVEEQEYKLRQVINQEMGYRNFIDFTNSYRIKEACDLLKDPKNTKMTILEIAYQTGFNSIGPFNRSFKQATRTTPTDYRKKHLNA